MARRSPTVRAISASNGFAQAAMRAAGRAWMPSRIGTVTLRRLTGPSAPPTGAAASPDARRVITAAPCGIARPVYPVGDRERSSAGQDHRRHQTPRTLAYEIEVEADERIAACDLLSLLNECLESFTAECHRLQPDVDKDFDTIGAQHGNGVARRAWSVVTTPSNGACTVSPVGWIAMPSPSHPPGEHRIGHFFERRGPARQGCVNDAICRPLRHQAAAAPVRRMPPIHVPRG